MVLANEEENRPADLAALRAAGLPVWVTVIRTLDEALASLRRMLTLTSRLPAPAWLDEAERAWGRCEQGQPGAARPGAQPAKRAGVPVWRGPWMVLGRDTFAGDVLARLGVANLYAGHAGRYPKVPLGDLLAARPELVVLPDEPYRSPAGDDRVLPRRARGPGQRPSPDLVRPLPGRGPADPRRPPGRRLPARRGRPSR